MQYDPSPITIKVIKWSVRTWWDDLTTLAMVNLVWVLCCFTIILGPPATLGVYYVAHELVHGQSLGMRGLIEGIRKYFWKSWAWALVNLFVFVVLWANIVFYANSSLVWVKGLPIVMLVLGLVWVVVQFYALPFMMLQENKSLPTSWRNGYVIAALSPGYTLVVFLVAAVVAAVSVAFALPLFLGAVPLLAILGVQATRDRVDDFKQRQRKQQEKKKDE